MLKVNPDLLYTQLINYTASLLDQFEPRAKTNELFNVSAVVNADRVIVTGNICDLSEIAIEVLVYYANVLLKRPIVFWPFGTNWASDLLIESVAVQVEDAKRVLILYRPKHKLSKSKLLRQFAAATRKLKRLYPFTFWPDLDANLIYQEAD